MQRLIFLLLSLALLPSQSYAYKSDLGLSYSGSDSSGSTSLNAAFAILETTKISLFYSTGYELDGSNNRQNENSTSVGLKHKFMDQFAIEVQGERSKEIYNYQRDVYGLKFDWNMAPIFGLKEDFDLRVSGNNSESIYTPNTTEKLKAKQISIGLEKRFMESFLLGAEYSSYSYDTTGTVATKNYFNGLTIISTDIANYLNPVPKTTASIYFEVNFSSATLGLSLSQTTPHFDNYGNSNTTGVYIDYELSDLWALNISGNRSRSASSGKDYDSYTAGLYYSGF